MIKIKYAYVVLMAQCISDTITHCEAVITESQLYVQCDIKFYKKYAPSYACVSCIPICMVRVIAESLLRQELKI